MDEFEDVDDLEDEIAAEERKRPGARRRIEELGEVFRAPTRLWQARGHLELGEYRLFGQSDVTRFDEVRAYLASRAGAGESYPFGPGAAVFKAGGKVFAIVSDADQRISLKGDPEDNLALRQMYPGITPGYHLNKKHWNTVVVAEVPLDEVLAMIDLSHTLIVESLSKAAQARLTDGA